MFAKGELFRSVDIFVQVAWIAQLGVGAVGVTEYKAAGSTTGKGSCVEDPAIALAACKAQVLVARGAAGDPGNLIRTIEAAGTAERVVVFRDAERRTRLIAQDEACLKTAKNTTGDSSVRQGLAGTDGKFVGAADMSVIQDIRCAGGKLQSLIVFIFGQAVEAAEADIDIGEGFGNSVRA